LVHFQGAERRSMEVHMKIGKWTLTVAIWLVSVFVAGMWGHAQVPLPPRDLFQLPPSAPQPAPSLTVISGNDIGFRIDSRRGTTPIGTLVIRINGEWVEPQESMAFKRLTERR
jgi:hypothetical protein